MKAVLKRLPVKSQLSSYKLFPSPAGGRGVG
jgi:hypothetical protein